MDCQQQLRGLHVQCLGCCAGRFQPRFTF